MLSKRRHKYQINLQSFHFLSFHVAILFTELWDTGNTRKQKALKRPKQWQWQKEENVFYTNSKIFSYSTKRWYNSSSPVKLVQYVMYIQYLMYGSLTTSNPSLYISVQNCWIKQWIFTNFRQSPVQKMNKLPTLTSDFFLPLINLVLEGLASLMVS